MIVLIHSDLEVIKCLEKLLLSLLAKIKCKYLGSQGWVGRACGTDAWLFNNSCCLFMQQTCSTDRHYMLFEKPKYSNPIALELNMACELGEAVLSDIMVRKAWQRNCGPRQVRNWVLETASKAGGTVEVLKSPHPSSSVPLGDRVWEPCTWRY